MRGAKRSCVGVCKRGQLFHPTTSTLPPLSSLPSDAGQFTVFNLSCMCVCVRSGVEEQGVP